MELQCALVTTTAVVADVTPRAVAVARTGLCLEARKLLDSNRTRVHVADTLATLGAVRLLEDGDDSATSRLTSTAVWAICPTSHV